MGSDIDLRLAAGRALCNVELDQRERAPCLVPLCRRTTDQRLLATRGDTEWICGNHWSGLPPAMRAIYRRARAAERRAAAADEAARQRLLSCPAAQVFRPDAMYSFEEARWPAVDRLAAARRRSARLWRICRHRAIGSAGGLR